MEFLSKLSQVRNSTAGLIIFFAWYIAASLTVVLLQGNLVPTLWKTVVIFIAVLVFMTIMFALSLLISRTDVVDAAWGPAFVVAAVTAFLLNDYAVTIGANVQTLVTVLVLLWAVRLSYTISQRLLRRPEDTRYVRLRNTWTGNKAFNTYVRIFFVQALLATLISSAVIHINLSLPVTIGVFASIGTALWIIGFCFEAIGDWQLKRHLADPANTGKLMTKGVWKYTRHPNYFGEATMWWGIFVIALDIPFGWLGIVTPVVITYLLIFVSGVPMTEKAFEKRKGWKEYKKRTSVFIPLPPK